MPDQPTIADFLVLACAGDDPPTPLDPQRYIYTPDDEQTLRRLANERHAHLVLCCCAEYVASCDQNRRLTDRWQKGKNRAGDDQKAAKVPFFGGDNGKGRGWQRHPANTRDLDIQLDERRGLVGILPASIGCIVFDADHDLSGDAERLVQLFGIAPLAIVASSQAGRGHIWYKLPEGHSENNRRYFLDDQPRGEIRASNGYVLLWRPSELLAQLTESMAGDPQPLAPEQIEQIRQKKPQANPRSASTARNDAELGRRSCDQGWEAERLAATTPGGRHNALASFMGHYRATTTVEQWPDVLAYLRLPFLKAKPEGSQEFDSLAEYFEATEAAKPLGSVSRAAHRNGHAKAQTPPNGEASQTAIESAEYNTLKEWLAPCWETITSTHDAARLIFHCADQLVIAYDPESPEATSDIYAVLADTGRLSNGAERLQQLLHEVSDRYLLEIIDEGLRGREFVACCKAARALREANSIKRLAAVMPGTVAELRDKGMLPSALVVKPPTEIDADLTVLGCKNGVVDLRTGELLPPGEARNRFVSASTGVDYVPGATHPAVDAMMPELPQNDSQRWWYQYRGWALTHRPRRDMCGMITPPGAGKSVLANADLKALGDYADTIRSEALQTPGRWSRGGTSHNGDILKFSKPRRLIYAPDCLGSLDVRLLNRLSGGDQMSARDVGEKVQKLEASAHLIIQGNPPDQGRQFLGLDEKTAEADAFRERLRLYPLEVIPKDQRRPEFVDLARDDETFREAWLARTVRQCRLMIDEQASPAGCETMAEAVRKLAAIEAPAWRSDWLSCALFRDKHATVNSAELYADYIAWHESEGDGKPQSRRAITTAIRELCGPGRRGRLPKNEEDQRPKATFWDGWRLDAPE